MHLSILNFKSIKHLEFDLKNLTILTGLNSSGKSSFIDSIRPSSDFADQDAAAGRRRVPFPQTPGDGVLH